ncbi:DnaD domain protein [Lysinibacillus sp. NPDC048646]|uniref:DnaD domain protein n=1 Tax=Lysinibacillus sp. NPDC048646 TaxID=3390574 RepID=UPI003D03C1AD
MTIVRVQKKEKYVVLDKGFLNDNRLSWKAKGLLAYMLSLPNDWSFCMADLATRSKCGRDATGNIVKELMNAGYIHKEQGRSNCGTFGKIELLVLEAPQMAPSTEKPLTDYPTTEKPQTVNPSLLITKSLNNHLLNNDNKDDRSYNPVEKQSKFQHACQFYEQNGFGSLASHVTYKISHWVDNLSEELVIHAMKLAVENNVLRWNYVEKILLDWRNKGLTTSADVKADRHRFATRKQQKDVHRGTQQGRHELIPEWFHQRHEVNVQEQASQAINFEAERQKILAKLEVPGRER